MMPELPGSVCREIRIVSGSGRPARAALGVWRGIRNDGDCLQLEPECHEPRQNRTESGRWSLGIFAAQSWPSPTMCWLFRSFML